MFRCLALSLLFLLSSLAQTSLCLADPVTPQSKAQISLSFAPLVKQVTPAVVNIYTQRLIHQRVSPLFDDPFFRQFFGTAMPQGMSRERLEKSLGSGVIVGADGLVVTSRHVIADADEIRVVLSDRREYDAKIVLSDEHADLALLHIEAKGINFPYLELEDSDDAQVGDLVLAIGNPFGVGQTVTMGIISALNHKALGDNDLGYFIQTDAAINPGNSGGAMVTMNGKLIGINSAIYSRDGGNMGIGFAVPANMVRLMMAANSQGKNTITHPWMGIQGQEITQDIALSLGMAQPSGFLVKTIHPSSPALNAGLQTGDVILSVNGHEVEDPEAFHYRITALPIGTIAEFGVLRAGQKITLKMEMIGPPEEPAKHETLIEGRNPVSGATIANLSPAIASSLGLDDMEKGVVVISVSEGTLAARVGLAPGDIIAAINGKKMASVEDVQPALKDGLNGWKLTIRRGANDVTMLFH